MSTEGFLAGIAGNCDHYWIPNGGMGRRAGVQAEPAHVRRAADARHVLTMQLPNVVYREAVDRDSRD